MKSKSIFTPKFPRAECDAQRFTIAAKYSDNLFYISQ